MPAMDNIFGHLPNAPTAASPAMPAQPAGEDIFAHIPNSSNRAVSPPAFETTSLAPASPPPLAVPKHDRSTLTDVGLQSVAGLYGGLEGTYYLPNRIINWGAEKLGYEPPFSTPPILTRASEAYAGEPQTTAGRYARSIGEITGASLLPVSGTIARGAEAVPAVTNALISSVGAGGASEAAKEAGLSPGWQLAASLAGGFAAPGAINPLLSKTPPDPRLLEKTLAAQSAQAEGITVPKAALANSVTKPLAGRLASLPVVGAPLQNAARTALDQTKGRLQELANLYGTGSRATAGSGVRDALVDYIGTGSAKPITQLYNQVDRLVDNKILNPLTVTQNTVKSLLSSPSATVRNVNKRVTDIIAKDMASKNVSYAGLGGTYPALPYQGIKQMRTVIGSMLDDKLRPDAGTTEPALRLLYKALTQDLRNAVENAGQTGALRAFDRANAAHAQAQQWRDALTKIVGKGGGRPGEEVFENIIGMAKNTGKSANINTLRLARKSVPSQAWSDMSSAFIRRMGLNPKTGDFSPDRFLTEYGKLLPEGKQVLFGGPGQNHLAHSLENLKRVSEQFSEFYRMGNPSGTAGATWLTGLFGGAYGIGGLPTALPGTLGMWGMSKYFASPANVNKMTKTLQARLAYARKPSADLEKRLSNAMADFTQSLQDQAQEQAKNSSVPSALIAASVGQ